MGTPTKKIIQNFHKIGLALSLCICNTKGRTYSCDTPLSPEYYQFPVYHEMIYHLPQYPNGY